MEAIEQAALELFAHKGYGNTSIALIAKEAGISKGLLYNYYTSKDHLLKSILTKAMDSGDHLLNLEMLSAYEPKEIIEMLVKGAIELYKTNPAYWKLMTSMVFQDEIIKEVGDIMIEKSRVGLAMMVPVFKKLKYPDPKAHAILFGVALDGIFLQTFSLNNEYNMEEMMDYVIKVFSKPYRDE